MQMMPQHPPDGIRGLALPKTGTSRARVLLNKCAVCHIDCLGSGRVAVTIEARIAFERDRVGDQLRTDRATCRAAPGILNCVGREINRAGDVGRAAAVDLVAAAWTADPILKQGNPGGRAARRRRYVEIEIAVDLHIRRRAARIVRENDCYPTTRRTTASRRRIESAALQRK